ncbi:MAG: long-chain fatty acid--CoA ligase [Candidatus Rokubacteria bacterium]|nr:long-chain fatty acid--CoA ligase [Candidatus Rokubacteria bacterium]
MANDTLARMFWDRVERSAATPAQQFKTGGVWKTITWREVGDVVRELALGLIALGRQKGDAVALLSGSRAEWVQADFAIFSAGCVTVPVYPSYPPRPRRVRRERLRRAHDRRRGPGAAREGAGGAGADAGAGAHRRPMEKGWVHLLFLPLAHSFARLESFLGVAHGLTTAFAENLDKVGDNLKETRPHFICSVPRVFEKVYAKILAGVEAGSPVKKKIFHWAVSVGRDVSRHQQRGQPVPAGLEWKRKIAHKLVFSKLHTALGGRLVWAVSGGAPLSRDIAEFFHAAGILLLEGYGLTETCPALTFNRPAKYKFGSVGQALPGVELRIAADGEILAKGPNIATRGYFKQAQATAEVFEPDGWFHTGDIGTIDQDGFLFITDRKKDLIVTAGGMNIAPQNVENLLKADPFISQVMVYGDRRPYPVALITLNPEELQRFARDQGLLTTDPAVIVKHPKILERVGRTVEEKNTQLQSYAQIKKFSVLPADFTLDGGELTPTLKVKRKVVSQKYQAAIEELYR